MKLKTILGGVIVTFVIYSIVTSPVTSAGLVRTLLVWAAGAIAQIFNFFGALLHGAAG